MDEDLQKVIEKEFGNDRLAAIERLVVRDGTVGDALLLSRGKDPLGESVRSVFSGRPDYEFYEFILEQAVAHENAGEVLLASAVFEEQLFSRALGLKWKDKLAMFFGVANHNGVVANEDWTPHDTVNAIHEAVFENYELDVLRPKQLELMLTSGEMFETAAKDFGRIENLSTSIDQAPNGRIDILELTPKAEKNMLDAVNIYAMSFGISLRQSDILSEDEQVQNYLLGVKAYNNFISSVFAGHAAEEFLHGDSKKDDDRKGILKEFIWFLREIFVNRHTLTTPGGGDKKGVLLEALNLLDSYMIIMANGKSRQKIIRTSLTGEDRPELGHPSKNRGIDAVVSDFWSGSVTYHQYKNKPDNSKTRSELSKYHPEIMTASVQYTPTEAELAEKLSFYEEILESNFQIEDVDSRLAKLAVDTAKNILGP